MKNANTDFGRRTKLAVHLLAPLLLVLITSSETLALKKYIYEKKTSQEGCSVLIVGVVEYSLFPPEITSFHGTVTISGGKDCPNGKMSFSAMPGLPKKSSKGLFVRLDSENVKAVRSATWSGNNSKAVGLLSEPKMNEGLCEAIRSPTLKLSNTVERPSVISNNAETASDFPPSQLESVWNLGSLGGGKIYPTQISVKNVSCKGKHSFAVTVESIAWLRIEGAETIKDIRMGETRVVSALVDLRHVKPGEYKGTVVIRCLTCPPKCVQDVSRLEARLVVR